MDKSKQTNAIGTVDIKNLPPEAITEYDALIQENGELRKRLHEEAEHEWTCSGFGISKESPVGIAIAYASSQRADADAQEILDEKLASFHDKWKN